MRNKEEIYDILLKNRRSEEQEGIDSFSDAVQNLYEIEADVSYVMKLLMLFNDDYNIVDPLYELQDYITRGNKSIMIEALMRLTGKMDFNWSHSIFRIFLVNSDNNSYFKSIYELLPSEVQIEVKNMFHYILDNDFKGDSRKEHLVERVDKPTQANIKFILEAEM